MKLCPECDHEMTDENEGRARLRFGSPSWVCQNEECPRCLKYKAEELYPISFTPAVIVTGADERGNEFAFWKTYTGEWVDGYNECATDIDFIRAHVFPNPQKVYFADLIMTGVEWIAAGCPMSLTAEQMRLLQDVHPADVAQELERDCEPTRSENAEMWDEDWEAHCQETLATRSMDYPL